MQHYMSSPLPHARAHPSIPCSLPQTGHRDMANTKQVYNRFSVRVCVRVCMCVCHTGIHLYTHTPFHTSTHMAPLLSTFLFYICPFPLSSLVLSCPSSPSSVLRCGDACRRMTWGIDFQLFYGALTLSNILSFLDIMQAWDKGHAMLSGTLRANTHEFPFALHTAHMHACPL